MPALLHRCASRMTHKLKMIAYRAESVIAVAVSRPGWIARTLYAACSRRCFTSKPVCIPTPRAAHRPYECLPHHTSHPKVAALVPMIDEQKCARTVFLDTLLRLVCKMPSDDRWGSNAALSRSIAPREPASTLSTKRCDHVHD